MISDAPDPRYALLAAPMSAFQKVSVTITVLLCMLDGFDVFAVTYAAPLIKVSWGLGQGQLGLVLSSGLLGMAAGSLIIAPAADIVGRRRMVFLSLALMIAGTSWSAATHNVANLAASRIFTGLGIGAMIAVTASLAAEYSSSRSRDFCLTMMGIGFPLGGTLGGFIAAYILPHYGWPAIFIAGALFGLIMLPASWVYLPEPIAPMIARPKSDTLKRVNDYLERCGMQAVAKLPTPPEEAKTAPLRTLFKSGMASVTLLITSIYFLHVITLFFVQTWVPSLIASEGFPLAQAALVGVSVNIGGIVGGLLLGGISMRFGLKTLVVGAMATGALLTALFGSLSPNFLMLALGAAAMGLCLQGAMMGLYAVVARTFPAHTRGSGTGLVIGVGRFGSAIGPGMAGLLFSAGVSRGSVAITMAIPSLIAAALLIRFRLRPPDVP